MDAKHESLLEIHDLSVSFKMYDHGFEQKELKVISNLQLSVNAGEIVAVVGSSGSGKSLLASAIMGILPENATVSGHLHYKGQELSSARIAALRGKELSLVPQSVAFLDPLRRVGLQVGEKSEKETVKKLFSRFELPENTDELYPHQLSGGMARRVLVSTALISDAELIIADEPTPGMDPEQALEALGIFRELADEGKGVILITHDLSLAVQFADKVAVFYAGTTVEIANADDFENGRLRHPYSRALWQALPQNGFTPIPGTQPSPGELPPGCLFAPRCKFKTPECETPVPMTPLNGGYVRCINAVRR